MSIPPGILLLTSSEGTHMRWSGYSRLTEFIPGAEVIPSHRHGPGNIFERIAEAFLNRLAFCRWYRLSSARLEWTAWRRIRQDYRGIVHILWADHDLGFLDLLLDRTRQKICATFHNCADTLEINIQRRNALKQLDAVILMAPEQAAFFRSHGVSEANLHVIPHGVDVEHYHPQKNRPRSETFTVLSVGSYRRDFHYLRQVCIALSADPAIRIRIVAPNHVRALFEDQPNVLFQSGLTDEVLMDNYGTASCFFHSPENATANNSLLEAMAWGLPIVSPRIDGVTFYAPQQMALVDPGNAASAAQAIQALARDAKLWEVCSRASRSKAETLDWPAVAAQTMAVYKQIWK